MHLNLLGGEQPCLRIRPCLHSFASRDITPGVCSSQTPSKSFNPIALVSPRVLHHHVMEYNTQTSISVRILGGSFIARILKLGAKIGNCKTFGHLIFQGGPQYTQIIDLNMHLLIEVSHNILTQFHVNYIKLKKKSIICLIMTFSKLLAIKFGCPEG